MSAQLPILLTCILLALGVGFVLGRRWRPKAAAGTARREGADRLETLGALAAGIVHEIAQPLSAARVSVEGLHYLRQIGRAPSPQQQARTLDRVGMSLLAMVQILDHLRYLAGGSVRSTMPARLSEAVASLIADRANWLRWSDVRIEMVEEGAAPPVLADRVGLRLVLANLVRNAAEAVASLPSERNWVRLRIGPGPVVAVVDPGPGIPPLQVDSLFQPFVSTRGEARGFGLSLARAAADRMGGELSYARRDEASGSVFTLRLRMAAP